MWRSLKLLLVGDSPEEADAAVRRIEGEGFAVAYRRVDSEADLLAALQSRWDVIVADHRLTTLSGMRALQIVKQHDPGVPFILLCPEADVEQAVAAMREGARYCLPRARLRRLGRVVAREMDDAEEQRKRLSASSALASQQRRYQRIFETSPVALLELDLSGAHRFLDTFVGPLRGAPASELIGGAVQLIRVLAANEAALELLGASAASRLEAAEVMQRDDQAWIDVLDGMHGTEPAFAREVAIGTMDGRELDVLLAFRVPRDPAALRNLTVSMTDISERKALEQRMRVGERLEAAGRLAGIVAHDFNNLLTVITGYAGLLLDTVSETAPIRRDLQAIEDAASSAEALTRRLLAFGRRRHFEPEVLRVNELLERMEIRLRRAAGDHVELSLVLADDLWPVRADPAHLEQIVTGLTENAREAMPDAGRLVIETRNTRRDGTGSAAGRARGEFVLLSVGDSGCGMTDDVRRQIFEPFFTTKGTGRGTGLGLSIVYGMVTQAGGIIDVTSAPGRGSTFEILLPRRGG